MAHPNEKKTQLRNLFVFQRLPMETAAAKAGVPAATAKRWKLEAKAAGDDWDTSRSAVALGDESFSSLSRQLLEDYLVQHQAVMKMLREDTALTALARAEILASASDSFNKTMSSFKRLSPELNRQAIALDVMQRMVSFAQTKYPQHQAAMIELLEPFGQEIAKAYG